MNKEKVSYDAVLKYYEDLNRPYSAQDVFMNLHKEHSKPIVQKVLDQLVVEEKLKEKINGKQKCYFFNQDQLPAASDAELAGMDAEVRILEEKITNSQVRVKKNQAKVLQLTAELTTQEAKQQLDRVKSQNVEMKARLSRLQCQGEVITAVEKKDILEKHEDMVKVWRKRKRMSVDILDAVLESWPKSKKDLYEEVGIETDEEVGVKLPK